MERDSISALRLIFNAPVSEDCYFSGGLVLGTIEGAAKTFMQEIQGNFGCTILVYPSFPELKLLGIVCNHQ